MSEVEEVVERLRHPPVRVFLPTTTEYDDVQLKKDHTEAAALIERLAARVAALEKAADDVLKEQMPYYHDSRTVPDTLVALAAALAALAAKDGHEHA